MSIKRKNFGKILRRLIKPFKRIRYFKSRAYHGHIDVFNSSIVTGWVAKRGTVQPVSIDIFVDGVQVAENLRANRPRQDLAEAGHGNGHHGFETAVKVKITDRSQVIVRRSGSRRDLLHGRSAEAREAYVSPATAASVPAGALIMGSRYKANIEKLSHNEIIGWSVDSTLIDAVFDLAVLVDGSFLVTVRNDQPRGDLLSKGISSGLGGFRSQLPLHFLPPGKHSISVVLPDDTHIDRSIVTHTGRKLPSFDIIGEERQSVTVIVPIYDAYEDVRICIQRLISFTPNCVTLLLIDDCSPDPRIRAFLDKLRENDNIRIMTNETNLGFTRTVNRGLDVVREGDVILLNSDARVTPRWISGLRAAARSSTRIATVTPMSDRAGAFSAPERGNANALPEGVSEDRFARGFRRSSLGVYPIVPTGNGFCLYITRAALDAFGSFDEEAFPKGYGEENDFCMRAFRAGWKHVIDDRTYVFHERSKSFGSQKDDLLASGRLVLDRRYPEYKNAISIFETGSSISLARSRARSAVADCVAQPVLPPRVLFVTSTQTGGTPQTNQDLMSALSGTLDCWHLRCDSSVIELGRFENGSIRTIRTHELDEPIDPLTHLSTDYDTVVCDWLLALDVDVIHIRHLAWHSLHLIRIARLLEIKLVFSFHDFYTISPTITLVDEADEFLGESFASNTPFQGGLWPQGSQPQPTGEWLRFWQERFQRELQLCDAFITTSQSARALIRRMLPALTAVPFHVIPHGRDFVRMQRLRAGSLPDEPLRILIAGNTNESKGLNVIKQLGALDQNRQLEFHVLGKIRMRLEEAAAYRFVLHGEYRRDEFSEKVAAIRPHIGAIFSIWDETYCHTLTEMWSVGIPAIVLDFPTLASRVRESGIGWVLSHSDVPALYRRIVEIGRDSDQLALADAALQRWQTGAGPANSTAAMAGRYLEIYSAVLGERRPDPDPI